MLRYPSQHIAGNDEAMGLAAFMSSQTADKTVILAMIKARNDLGREALVELKAAERIEFLYSLADTETKRWLDALVTEICGKSLKELLKPEEPKAPFSV
jgi:hypothetical protein